MANTVGRIELPFELLQPGVAGAIVSLRPVFEREVGVVRIVTGDAGCGQMLTHPPCGGCHSNSSGYPAKNASNSGRFSAMMPRLRASSRSRARNPINASTSDGPALQIDV